MHGPRCFLQEPPGHVHLCMGAYGEHSSRLRNFEGFKLVTNLKETKEAKCKKYYLLTEYFACADLYPFVDRLYEMYIAFSKHVLFYFHFVPSVNCVHIYFRFRIRIP